LPKDLCESVSKKTDAKIETVLKRHIILNKARLEANKSLVEKAMRTQLVQDKLYKAGPEIAAGKYVLV
jgi:hypothetical protein